MRLPHLLLFAASLFAAAPAARAVDVIPLPASVQTRPQDAPFSAAPAVVPVYIGAPRADRDRIARYLAQSHPEITIASGIAPRQLRLLVRKQKNAKPEAYTLRADSDAITVTAASGAGLFRGLQTALQLLDDPAGVPAMTVADAPRLPYRGLLLDVSRNFRDKEWVMKQLDAMAALKINKLHFHLTDGAGWRLQTDAYPLLTELGAWRKGATWKEWNASGHQYLPQGHPEASGGFYTKDDIREIVAYAADRYIDVIPEIEMPAHSEAATAAYPSLSCTHTPGQGDLCPGNEETFRFIETVLSEVMELFPSEYIHIGADEASKSAWRECTLCQARMKRLGISDVDGLQSYMMGRVVRFLRNHGRKAVGWDEITQGGLPAATVVMNWRSPQIGFDAAAQGHDVIVEPGSHFYLDAWQDAPHTQPEAFGGYLPLEKIYSYNPVPDTLSQRARRHIIGVEATLFTEMIPTASHAEYMLYPRAYALAESGWTPQSLRADYPGFRSRAARMASRMRRQGYNVFDITNEFGNRPEALKPVNHLARGKKVTFNRPWWRNYPANGDSTLTDGLRGGWNYNDGRWLGFSGSDNRRMDVTVDLGESTDISFIGADFMQLCQPWVYFPTMVAISVSDDGENFRPLGVTVSREREDGNLRFRCFSWSGSARARYVRYRADTTRGILFTDELIIR